MRVAVIGSSGGMGNLLVRYFVSRGSEVTGSDTRASEYEHPYFKFVRSNEEAVRGADVVVVATPIALTVETVVSLAGRLSSGTTLVEMTSVKGKVLPEVERALRGSGVRLLSIHPLFGPSLSNFSGMRVCVVRTDGDSLDAARHLFPDATLIPMERLQHDRVMALVLSATHVLNLAYAGTVNRYLSPDEFRNVQTPTSGVQLTLAEGILSQDPSLYSYIQVENEHAPEVVAALIDELTRLLRQIQEKDRAGFEARFTELSGAYAGDSRDALDLVYQAFEKAPG